MGDKKVTLKLEKVSKSFAKIETDEVTHALNEIDLTLNSGEFISLVGPSGCGKSTILRLVAGLIVPTKGTVSVDGKEVKEPSPERGMVFQKPTLFPWLTVEKNIAFSLRMQGKLKGNEDKVKRMIDVIGLEAFKDDYPDQLSGGMAQRVALVRSLINEPDILLLDEPLGALDAFTRMNMQDEILKIWYEKQQLAIMVTHDVDEALLLANRILVLGQSPSHIIYDVTIPEEQHPTRDTLFENMEMMKLRMLNGSHSFLAYLGYLGGYETIADTVTNPAYRKAAFALMMQEQAPTLSMPEGTDLNAYATLLIERFSNPSLRHRTWQIAMDGSQKLPQRLLDPVRLHLQNGGSWRHLALGVAGWMRYTQGVDEQGNAIDVVDPMLAEFQKINAQYQGADRVKALLGLSGIFADDLPQNADFVGAVTAAYQQLCERGARECVAAL